jgi:uroporphyrinogen-III synthase
LADALRKRGATVAYAEVYRRVPTHGDASSLIDAWRRGTIDAVTVTSGDALSNLLRILRPAHADLLARTSLAVMGERLADLARHAGFRRVAVATESSDEGLCEAVISLAQATQA